MAPLGWTVVVVGSVITGAAVSSLLVVVRRREPIAMVIAVSSVSITVAASAALSASLGRPEVIFIAGLISLGGFAGGYGLVAALLSTSKRHPFSEEILANDSGARTLVLIVVDVEPERYLPGEVTRRIDDLTAAGLPEPTLAVLPFFYAGHKARYRSLGGSAPGLSQVRAVIERVASKLDQQRFTGPVLVDCTDGASLDAAIATATARGYTKIVVATPYVSDPYPVYREKQGPDTLTLRHDSVSVAYTSPLWGSERLAQRMVDRVTEAAGQPEHSGVALVIHGQPGEREKSFAGYQEQENAFANRVRMALLETGFDQERVRLCWDAWREPGVTETVRHLAVLGSTCIVVIPVTQPFDDLDTLLELPASIRQARTPSDVRIVRHPPWQDDPVIAEEIARSIEATARELAKESMKREGGQSPRS